MALVSKLHYCGANFPRVSYRKDAASGLWLPGYCLEGERIQLCRYNRAHDLWASKVNCTVPTTNALAPDGTLTADVLHEDATAGVAHYIDSGAYIQTATNHITYCIVKAINRSWVCLSCWSASLGNKYAYFDVTNVVASPTGLTALRSGIEDLKGGWCLCWMDNNGFAEVTSRQIRLATGAGAAALTFDGLNQDSLYVWGSQHEAGLFPSSVIINDGTGSVTRTADSSAVWVLGAEMARREWTLTVPVMVPAHTPAADLKLLSVYKNGAAATDHVTLWAAQTTGYAKVTSAGSGLSAGSLVGARNIADGALHWVSVHVRHGQVHLFVDTTDHAADLDAGIPADLDRYAIEPSGAWIGGAEIVPEFRERQTRPAQPQLLRE